MPAIKVSTHVFYFQQKFSLSKCEIIPVIKDGQGHCIKV